MMTEQVLHLF